MVLTIVLAVMGVALLALATWLRLGRTSGARSWVGERQTERMVLVTVPLVGVAAVALAVMTATEPGGLQTVAVGVLALAVVAFLLFNPVGLPLPGWSLPRWYRSRAARQERRQRRRRDRSGNGSGRVSG